MLEWILLPLLCENGEKFRKQSVVKLKINNNNLNLFIVDHIWFYYISVSLFQEGDVHFFKKKI